MEEALQSQDDESSHEPGHSPQASGQAARAATPASSSVRVAAEELLPRVADEVIAVAVVDVAVVVVVQAVAADFARVRPDVPLQVRVRGVEARVDDRDDDRRVPGAARPGLVDADGVVVGLQAAHRVVDLVARRRPEDACSAPRRERLDAREHCRRETIAFGDRRQRLRRPRAPGPRARRLAVVPRVFAVRGKVQVEARSDVPGLVLARGTELAHGWSAAHGGGDARCQPLGAAGAKHFDLDAAYAIRF